ncbi:DotI/IcmL/TraM family protein [uncultured Desulfovibrio sp.]|uniref:DotI/IcmL/TraM family protein n=1 Tax=uncultured Desulfovibrio sp. TaxID=167968 RepID=UPI00272B59AC|nr:DotI/IcmL/TraM family protein [uncultured Desulfovibrio sp.]
MSATHADAPAPDAAVVIGGLDWYRTQFRRTMKLALTLTVALCVSLGVVAILLLNQPKPRYFAATPDLRLAPMVPLDQPLLTQDGLLTWASNAITGAMSLNFLEWREKLESIRPHFEDEAFKSFLASLKSSGILEMIQDKRLSASAVATRAPVIIASGLVGGRATWKIEFPLIVSYESSQGVESTQKLLATVLVCRASTARTPRGVVIQQVVLKRES